MASRRIRKLTLKEASEHAYEHGLINGFHHLNDDEKSSLGDLLRRTRWNQSEISRAKFGAYSRLQAFHDALKRLHPFRKAQQPYGSPLRRKAETAENYAYAQEESLIGSEKFGGRPSKNSFEEVISAFSTAADAWDDIGERREALRLRRYAEKLAQKSEGFPSYKVPVRDKLRFRRNLMRRRRTLKHTKTRRDARSPRVSAAKRAWIQKKIRLLRHEGYPPLQSVAIAHRMAGVPRPNRPTKHLTPVERRQSLRARHRRARTRAR